MQDVVAHIASERAGLLGAIAGRGGADWDRSTVCDPWTVKDVLAHMVEAELVAGRLFRREITSLEHADPEVGIAKWRALPGEAVRAALWQHGVATLRVLERMDPSAWGAPIDALGCARVSQLARLHLFDAAVHGHDVTDALELPPVWGPRLPFLVEYVVRAAPKVLTRKGVAADGNVTLVVGQAAWTIRGDEDGWRLGDGDGSSSVTADPEDLVLYVTGRRDREETGFAIGGDAERAEKLLAGWRIFE